MSIRTLQRLPPSDSDDHNIRLQDLRSGLVLSYAGNNARALPCRLRAGEEMLLRLPDREWQADGEKALRIKA